MRTDDLDFELPPELIAQTPPAQRGDSRLLHYRSSDRTIAHRRFSDLPVLLRAGDLLVFNDARVIPARFVLRKITGGRVEGLFLDEIEPGVWDVLVKNLGPSWKTVLRFDQEPLTLARVLEEPKDGRCRLAVDARVPALAMLERIGRMPLPPYIKRQRDHDPQDESDRTRYQTIYADKPVAVAAPTAGLHFTPEVLEELQARKIEMTRITLHVGLGTFKPVMAENLEDHPMHAEAYTISSEAAEALNRAKSQGRRIVAIGTTSARVLESQPENELFVVKSGVTSIFIYPPYSWKHVGALLTNFHLPRSTLVALVAARIGLDEQRRAYREAIEQKYRFFSYGDAMFIE